MTSFLTMLWALTLAGAGISPTAPRTGYDWPLQPPPAVVRRFEPPPQPWAAGHRGVDLLGVEAATVHSAGPGVVTWSGVIAGRGVVAVTHPTGWRTTYEPLEDRIPAGTPVATGTPVGALAAGHCPPRVCLHWGLVIGDRTYRDPLTLLRPPRVVLLPVL